MAKGTDKVERQRAYWNGGLVTIIQKGRRSSTIRTAHGFVHEDVPNRELDFDVPEENAVLRYEPPKTG